MSNEELFGRMLIIGIVDSARELNSAMDDVFNGTEDIDIEKMENQIDLLKEKVKDFDEALFSALDVLDNETFCSIYEQLEISCAKDVDKAVAMSSVLHYLFGDCTDETFDSLKEIVETYFEEGTVETLKSMTKVIGKL